jgi:glycosyltransferase A (GT-A) superfamily protein (DUF2064 family)
MVAWGCHNRVVRNEIKIKSKKPDLLQCNYRDFYSMSKKNKNRNWVKSILVFQSVGEGVLSSGLEKQGMKINSGL